MRTPPLPRNVLTRKERKSLRARVRRLGVPDRHCDDVAQNIEIALWKAEIQVPEGRTWQQARRDVLHGITRRQVARYRREEAAARLVLVPEAASHVPVPSAETLALDLGCTTMLRTALDELRGVAPDAHELLVAFYLNEEAANQLAQDAGVCVNTLHSRLQRARGAIRTLYSRGFRPRKAC